MKTHKMQNWCTQLLTTSPKQHHSMDPMEWKWKERALLTYSHVLKIVNCENSFGSFSRLFCFSSTLFNPSHATCHMYITGSQRKTTSTGIKLFSCSKFCRHMSLSYFMIVLKIQILWMQYGMMGCDVMQWKLDHGKNDGILQDSFLQKKCDRDFLFRKG